MTPLLWTGAIGAWLFVIVFLLDGWTRRGFRSMRHPVSALALGSRGWLQIANFIVCGVTVTVAAGAVAVSDHSLVLLACTIGVFGLALIVSGLFRMDPMWGYPPGAPRGTPKHMSFAHRVHDHAGTVVFSSLPAAAMIATLVLDDPLWRSVSGLVAVAAVVGLFVFGSAWERESPAAGLIQRLTIIPGWAWLGALFVHLA